jgi:hypothetical protein
VKVLFLGAGASKAAGYPLAADLFAEIEKAATSSPVPSEREDWANFHDWRSDATGILKRLLNDSNPEVVLSIPDLMEESLRSELRDLWYAAKSGSITAEDQRERLAHPLRRVLQQSTRARDCLLRCMDHYFMTRHWHDNKPESRDARNYLRQELSSLSAGDVIVTTNWDALIERTLAEDGRWTPSDGYGFPIGVKDEYTAGGGSNLLPRTSEIRVLKIHGSYGWRTDRSGDGSVVLQYANFLHHLPVGRGDHSTFLRDVQEVMPPPAGDSPTYLYPSYVKSLAGTCLQRVWFEAGEALRSASTVKIIGSSLPRADAAVRALLNPLRFRLEQDTVAVTVEDPKMDVLSDWRSFLGGRGVHSIRKSLGD